MFRYEVDAFVPSAGCSKQDSGWDAKRCGEFESFLNGYAKMGFRLHSCEYRKVEGAGGCIPASSTWLVCIFERAVSDKRKTET